MPTLDVSTKSANQVWASPDGQRVIFEVLLDYKGQTFRAKTYSKDISVVGWTGEVESYEKPGRNGIETFVKQPAQEGYAGGNSRAASQGGSKPPYQPKDEAAIKAMFAIKSAVAALGNAPMEEIEVFAQGLFAMVERVKASENASEAPSDEVHLVLDDAPVDLSKIKEIMGDVTPVEKDTPWPEIPKT